ncbi:hypothetical protein [Bifidobacterium catulorum]|uniref:Uncharacterized protein n=1 Tax=Bifidobacterium catulorum TaxID=1630173 RepID=A0A2U2MTT2_9BIFI|nr:hypothetical protein [Bifidobacterium catulorum]PWG60283.1 hypothetical protein DF200_03525 [Bifidobacterium catulorum]
MNNENKGDGSKRVFSRADIDRLDIELSQLREGGALGGSYRERIRLLSRGCYAELMNAGIGTRCVTLIIEIMRHQFVAHSYFNLIFDYERSDDSASQILDLVNDFYLDKIDSGRNGASKSFDVMLLTKASCDDDLVPYLTTSIGNWLQNRLNATPLGRLRQRVSKRLERSPERFVQVEELGGETWGLRDGSRVRFEGDLQTLASVTLRYPIKRYYPKEGAKRDPQIGARSQLENMLEGVFKAADACLTLNQLVSLTLTDALIC